MRTLRRLTRMVRVVWALVSHTASTERRLRRLSPEARPTFQARRVQEGMQALCHILGLDITRVGTPPPGALLYVSNHLGLLDTLILGSQLPVAFASKAEVREWPLLGWVTRTVGTLFVERTRRTQTAAFVEQVQSKLEAGVSVLVFPEGTTGPGGTVMPFKTGAFEAVAGEERYGVLPIYLEAVSVENDPARWHEIIWTGKTFAEHGWHLLGLRQVRLRVHVGTPLPAAGHTRKTLARQAHAAVVALGPETLAPVQG